MSDTTNYHGPVINMHGGQGNVGINHGTAGNAPQDAELRAAVAELTLLLRDLRPHLDPRQTRAVDDALPELTPNVPVLRERGHVLTSMAQIATAVGTAGDSVADAVRRLNALLGRG